MDRDLTNKLLEGLVNDLKALLLETKKKHPQIKEVREDLHYIIHMTSVTFKY